MAGVEQPTSLRRSVNDAGEFESFYRLHAEAMLVFFARRTLDPHLALELTAETFAQAFRKRGQFRGTTDEEAAGWLYRIAHNHYAKVVRSGEVKQRALRRLQMQTPSYSESDVARVHELAELDGLREQVADRFRELPAIHRDAVSLRVVDELSYPEVAERLGISEQTARTRVSRGLGLLRQTLKTAYEERLA